MSAQDYLANDFPLLSAFWSMLWFFLWIMWFVLLFRVVLDIFRDDSLSGGAKAGWLVFCVVLPFLGVFVYVLARGRNMGRRETDRARPQQQAFDSYARQTARGGEDRPSSVDELARLSEIRTRGDITDEEFRRAKELVLSGSKASGASAPGTPTSGR
ncbi:putative membrane protein [Streptomyces luteogriseus]|uniref:SHOCT domain-containing protein n=1 Tax=Streptomyces luteogriseus TaxID=68233 RepID=UPI0027866E98|nr:SHOCT domain-containing protein [Streptomyces luteogriseus]MDQ0717331.1 putative membrane protein [Streptomyces luteogriseus]